MVYRKMNITGVLSGLVCPKHALQYGQLSAPE